MNISGTPSTPGRRNRLFAQATGVFVSVLGGVALIGWWFNIEALKSIVPAVAPIKPNMAAAFLLCGTALALLSRKKVTPLVRKCTIAIAGTVVLLAALTLEEHFFGWDLPIEQWLIGNAWPDQRILHPGRMTSVTALAFLLGGSALLAKSLFVRRELRVPLVVGLSAALLLMGATPLAAFLLEILFGSQWNFMGMGLSSTVAAIGFMLLGSGLLALLQSEGHLTWSLSASTTSGFALGFLLIVIAAAACFNFTLHMVETSNRVTHRQEILKETEEVLREIASLASSERVYVIVGNEQFLDDRKATKTALDEDMQHLRALTHDNPNQQRRLDRLERLITQRIDWEERVIAGRRQEGPAEATRMIATGPGLELSDEILRMTKEIEAEEYSLLQANRKSADSAVSTAFALLPTVAFLSLAVLALSAFFLNAGVTEQVRADNALRKSEEGMRAILESALDCIITMNHHGRIVEFNPAAEKTFGYRRDDAVGQLLADLIIPQSLRERHRCGLVHYLATGEAPLIGKHIELSAIKKNGTEFPVEIAITRIGTQEPPLFTGFLRDITQRKQAEESLREQADIIHRAHDAVIVRDFETDQVTIWNRGAERLYGWTAKEALGRPLGDLIFAQSSEREALIKRLISTGEFHGEIKHRAKDGEEVIVDARVTLIRNDDGTPRSVLGINTDVTEQKKLEIQLLRAQRLESIGTLASGLAHDLNNILTPILMCVQTLRSELAEKDRQSALSLIAESAQRGAAVLKQVLTFARGVEGERVLIKPSHLIEEMTDIARKTFPKWIEIKSRYPEDLWSIEGDPTQLHQVLLNLFVNARDAMPEGGLLTFVAKNFKVDENYASMTPGAKAGPCVVFSVSDTGGGMPPATIDKIFDPFFTTKEVGKGTGLGLSMALGIVKSHGGFISVYSEIGKGTTFKIFIPAAMSEENLQQPNRVAPGSGLLWPIAPRDSN